MSKLMEEIRIWEVKISTIDHFVNEFKRKFKKDLSGNQIAMALLRKSCEKAKRTLSTTIEARVVIPNILEKITFDTRITRAKFESLNADLFHLTIDHVKNTLNDAGMIKTYIDEIVLVGGSTRIVKIQKLLQDFFDGKDLYKSINPDEAVAYGKNVCKSF